jgi:hypothetical protein
MEIRIGQQWISEKYPHESFIIYDGIPEEKIMFWRRSNSLAFEQFIVQKKGKNIDELISEGRNTYPYAWAGECSISSLKSKIKKYEMYTPS